MICIYMMNSNGMMLYIIYMTRNFTLVSFFVFNILIMSKKMHIDRPEMGKPTCIYHVAIGYIFIFHSNIRPETWRS